MGGGVKTLSWALIDRTEVKTLTFKTVFSIDSKRFNIRCILYYRQFPSNTKIRIERFGIFGLSNLWFLLKLCIIQRNKMAVVISDACILAKAAVITILTSLVVTCFFCWELKPSRCHEEVVFWRADFITINIKLSLDKYMYSASTPRWGSYRCTT